MRRLILCQTRSIETSTKNPITTKKDSSIWLEESVTGPIPLTTRKPHGFWNSVENHRKFLDEFARQFNITSTSDWKRFKAKEIAKLGGRGLFGIYPTFFDALQTIYPEKDWKVKSSRTQVPRRFWEQVENQRNFLDAIEKEYNLHEPSDWMKITTEVICKRGGRQLLRIYPSFVEALETVYPDRDWSSLQNCPFKARQPKNFWHDKANVKGFLEHLKKEFKITQTSDWYRISVKQIKALGGSTLLARYGNLLKALKAVYPEEQWNSDAWGDRSKRASQRWLFLKLKEMFTKCEIIEEFQHEELSRISGRSVELDVFIPRFNLAFEYQGMHHFHEIPAFGSIDLYKERDIEKKKLCSENGVDLVEIPYWWDGSIETLKDLILAIKPNFFDDLDDFDPAAESSFQQSKFRPRR